MGGKFETAMGGTFHSATDGTFETVMGGTIKPLLSNYYHETSKQPITQSQNHPK